MSIQFFLNVEQALDIIMQELPDGVYAEDRADDPDFNKRSYSSSELRAHAQMIADLYENLQTIFEDKFVSIATANGLIRWEGDLFSNVQDSSLPLETRRQNALAKFRATVSISEPAINSIISGILTPLGLNYAILPYSGGVGNVGYGAWIFEYSQLEFDTWLAALDPLWGTGIGGTIPLDCSRNYAAAGLTLDEMNLILQTAYLYEVRIYGNADSMTLALLDKVLTQFEPARSNHIIVNNA